MRRRRSKAVKESSPSKQEMRDERARLIPPRARTGTHRDSGASGVHQENLCQAAKMSEIKLAILYAAKHV